MFTAKGDVHELGMGSGVSSTQRVTDILLLQQHSDLSSGVLR